MKRSRWLTLGVAAATSALVLAACAPPEKDNSSNTTDNGVDAAKATSVADFGTMDDLVKAAQAEGELNVIALPPDWANYGEIITAFEDKYDITVNSDQPDIGSQDEINTANQLKGILGWTDQPNISIDFNHDSHSSTFHMDQTKVMEGTLVRVMSWYDNEWGFSNRMADTAVAMGKLG